MIRHKHLSYNLTVCCPVNASTTFWNADEIPCAKLDPVLVPNKTAVAIATTKTNSKAYSVIPCPFSLK